MFQQLFRELMIIDNYLNEKEIEVNLYLKELCKGKNIFLTENSREIKAQHYNKVKLRLTNCSLKVLSNNFVCK